MLRTVFPMKPQNKSKLPKLLKSRTTDRFRPTIDTLPTLMLSLMLALTDMLSLRIQPTQKRTVLDRAWNKWNEIKLKVELNQKYTYITYACDGMIIALNKGFVFATYMQAKLIRFWKIWYMVYGNMKKKQKSTPIIAENVQHITLIQYIFTQLSDQLVKQLSPAAVLVQHFVL